MLILISPRPPGPPTVSSRVDSRGVRREAFMLPDLHFAPAPTNPECLPTPLRRIRLCVSVSIVLGPKKGGHCLLGTHVEVLRAPAQAFQSAHVSNDGMRRLRAGRSRCITHDCPIALGYPHPLRSVGHRRRQWPIAYPTRERSGVAPLNLRFGSVFSLLWR